MPRDGSSQSRGTHPGKPVRFGNRQPARGPSVIPVAAGRVPLRLRLSARYRAPDGATRVACVPRAYNARPTPRTRTPAPRARATSSVRHPCRHIEPWE